MLNETTQHYNLDVDFFQSFLDSYMKYTSGLFLADADDLELAVTQMLDKIIDFGQIRNGSRVLEIGPGWGSLIRRLRERDIICDYQGISPSDTQNNYIRDTCGDAAKLDTVVFEHWIAKEKFDAIILIGSFCHLSDKQAQLKKMSTLLKPQGVIVIEDTFFISSAAAASHATHAATRFVQNKIFGFAEILSLAEQIDQISHADLKIVQMLEHSESYKKTISHWIRRLRKIDSLRHPNAREFIKYLKIAQRGWGYTTQNQLMVLARLP